MAQQAGQRLSRRRKALEEVGASTACAMTNATTQAGLCSGAQLAPLRRHSTLEVFWKCQDLQE